MGIGQTVSHAQTLPGDQIIGFRILNESYNPNNPYQWRLIVEVNYSYNTAHGTMPKVVGYIIGMDLDSEQGMITKIVHNIPNKLNREIS